MNSNPNSLTSKQMMYIMFAMTVFMILVATFMIGDYVLGIMIKGDVTEIGVEITDEMTGNEMLVLAGLLFLATAFIMGKNAYKYYQAVYIDKWRQT